jgi:hypothetical protein
MGTSAGSREGIEFFVTHEHNSNKLKTVPKNGGVRMVLMDQADNFLAFR